MSVDVLLSDIDSFIKAPNGIKELRSILMQLAIMGKLIEQSNSDGNANDLIKIINKKREELIKLKEFKKSPKYEKVEIDAVPFDIPETWEWSTLSRLGQINPKNIIEDDDIDSSFLPMAAISEKYGKKPSPEIRKWSEIKKGFTHVSDQDVAVAKITPCFENGKACVLEGLMSGVGSGTTELHVFRPVPNTVLPKYIYLFLKSPEFNLKGRDHMTGTAGQKRVSAEFFATTPVPVPPLEEQKRIVTKIDDLMVLCDQLEAQQQQQANTLLKANTAAIQALLSSENSKDDLKNNWQRLANNFHTLYGSALPMPPGEGRRKKHLIALENVRSLRKSIIQLGILGKLVKQSNCNETGDELFKKIKEERGLLVSKKVIKKPKDLPEIDKSEISYEPPKSWKLVRLGELAELINGDRGKNYPNKSEYVENGIAFINTGHIDPDGSLSKKRMNYITQEKYGSLRSGKIEQGDLVYCLRGATFGKTAFVDNFSEGAIASSLMIIRLSKLVDNRFFYYFLISPYGQSLLRRFDNGSAQPNLSANSVKLYVAPLPPFEEQQRIVSKIEDLLVLCSQLEQQLTTAYDQAEKLITATTKALVA